MNDPLYLAALVLVLCGALLCLTASIGLLRFRDVLSRLHAATKPQILGLMLILLGLCLAAGSWQVVAFSVPIMLIQFATSPLSAHMVGRQAYRNETYDKDSLVVDELAEARAARRSQGD